MRLQHSQLLLCLTNTGVEHILALEDLGYICLDHPQVTLSQPLLQAIGKLNIALIVCDTTHHPLTLMLPLYHHHLAQKRFNAQITAPMPLKKQLWKEVIKKKLANQARLLEQRGAEEGSSYLYRLSQEVKSGDTTKREAIGARYYWACLLGNQFKRDPRGPEKINAALNYGYAILRSAIARALIGSGLLPIVGINHHNQYNPYPLADDIMEPYRPFVDQYIAHFAITPEDHTPLTMDERSYLLGVITYPCIVQKGKSTLWNAIEETTQSLASAFENRQVKDLIYTPLPHHSSPHVPLPIN